MDGGAITQFLPLILIFAIMYFLLIRPQQKKGGIIGKVSKVKEDGEIEIEIAEGVKVRVIKATIAQVISKTEPAA
jgi:preprotein translocase subunit YajC